MKLPKNVLFIHHGGNWIRGSEECLLLILKNLNKKVITPTVICNNNVMVKEINKINITTHLFSLPEIIIDGTEIRLQLIKYLKTLFKIYKIIKKKKIDIIYCNTGLPCQIGVPLSRFLKIPLICHFHHPASKRYYYFWLVKFATIIIFPSEFTKQHSLAKAGIDGKVIYNGIDNVSRFYKVTQKDYSTRNSLNINQDDIVISQVGALTNNKRHDILIKAFQIVCKKFTNVKLLIIGEGPNRKYIEGIIQKINLTSKIKLLGYVDSVEHYMQNVIDIHVLASTEEGLGLVVLQASACGIPNIVTNCTGLKEVLQNEITGYLFKPEDFRQLADNICKLVNNPLVRKKMGDNGIKMVKKSFSQSKYIESIHALILNTK